MLEALGAVALALQAVAPPADPQIIVVTGRGLDADEELVGDVTLGREEIERSASGRMEDVLRDVAGLASFRRSDSRSAHPTSQGLTLRGLGGNAASRMLVTLDGVPQADPVGGWIGFSALDPHAVDRIRVVRGGGSGLAGPGAVAGTIDIDSRAIDPGGTLDALLMAGSRHSLDAHLVAGTRWSDGFSSFSGSFARSSAGPRSAATTGMNPSPRALSPGLGAGTAGPVDRAGDRSATQRLDLRRPQDARHRP